MDHRTEISDLRAALDVLRDTPGQLAETNAAVDPAAELSIAGALRQRPAELVKCVSVGRV